MKDLTLPKQGQGWLHASRRVEDPNLTTDMVPFLKHNHIAPIQPGQVHELRIELLPMSFLVRNGERMRLEIKNWESAITEAPMTHWYGQKDGTDTYHHSFPHPSYIRLHERPRRRRHATHAAAAREIRKALVRDAKMQLTGD